MSTSGLRAAFADNIRLDVGEGLFVRVASAKAITVLKMAASLDRPERERDLEDLAHLMETIVGVDDPERWSDSVMDLELDYELVSPFVLGRRVAALADDREKAIVERFLARMIRLGPEAWRDDDAALARLDAFRGGFSSSLSRHGARPK